MNIKVTRKIATISIIVTILFSQTIYASSLSGTSSQNDSQASGSSTLSQAEEQAQALETIGQSGKAYISSTGPTGRDTSLGYVVIGGAMPDGSLNTGSQESSTQSSSEQSTSDTGSSSATTQVSTDTTTETGATTETTTGDVATVAPSQITIDTSIALPQVQSDYAILYDASSGQVLYEKNADTATPPASTTKLMTALVVLEQYSAYLSKSITFSQSVINSLESGATTAHMSAGDTLTVEQALNAILVGSACDVAAQLATSLAGSEAAFATLMTQKAVSLGCTNTNFANASGLNSDVQYTTARDMARITVAALSNDTIRTMIVQPSYTLPATSSRGEYVLTNTNHFINGTETAPSGYLGGKTGYTSLAGQCLASMALVNGRNLVTVVLKTTRSNQYTDCKSLYDYGKKLLDAAGVTDSSAASSGDSTSSGSSSGANTTLGSWEQTTQGTKFKKADGTYCVSEWLDLDGNTYFFDPDGYVCTGWQRFSNDTYYYFDPNNGGAMVKNKWVTDNGKSYYMSSTGVMATNTVINGMYRVDENGVYVEKVG